MKFFESMSMSHQINIDDITVLNQTCQSDIQTINLQLISFKRIPISNTN